MPKKIGTVQWRQKRKKEHLEKRIYRYYIFCEGTQTEPQYFKGFKRLIEENPIYRDMVLVEIEPCGAETLRVVNQAEKYVRDNDITKGQIWCVYDKDSFPPEHFNGAQQRIDELNRQGNDEIHYHAAWSNECIEFWFLLHFCYYTSNNIRTEYIKTINNYYRKYGINKYQKNSDETFRYLLEYGDPKAAIRYAKKIISSHPSSTPSNIAPGTKVYELVEELAKYLQDDIRKRFMK